MTIYRRKSGRWAVLVDVDRGGDGRRSRRTLGTYAPKKDAERAEREALAVRDRGIDLNPRSVVLGEIVERFLREAKTRLSPTTTHRYEELWTNRIAPSFAGIPVARLRPAPVADLYTRLGSEPIYRGRPLNARTVHHIHRFLHRVFAWAEKLNLVERNVIRAVDAPASRAVPGARVDSRRSRTVPRGIGRHAVPLVLGSRVDDVYAARRARMTHLGRRGL